jgi:phosphate transport system permease protein
VLRAAAAVAAGLLALVTIFMVGEAAPVLGRAGDFLGDEWFPTTGRFGMAPMVWATLSVTAGAIALAAPLGIASALFCQLYAPPRLAAAYRRLVQIMAGVPSVVYGLWGLVALVPAITAWQPPGASLLAGVVVLTLMILPTVALLVDAALTALPPAYLRSAAALGMGRAATVAGVLLPAARRSTVGAVILAVGRAVGETMAVLMVCGNVVQTPASLFDPVRTLTANIALEMAYALDAHRAALFASGLLLLLVAGALVALGNGLGGRAHAS